MRPTVSVSSLKRHMKHQRRHSLPGSSSSSLLGDGAATEISVEVRAIPGPQGVLKDEIMIVMPLPPEKELDDDPLYYYPPSTPTTEKAAATNVDSPSDTESESDSDEDDDEFGPFPAAASSDSHNPQQPRSILNTGSTTTVKKIDDEPTSEEYSFMEELMQTLDTIFGCSYGGCLNEARCAPVLKSALRSSKRRDEYGANRSVSFTKLEIREFNMTLGNHPSAVTGPPVMLDWDARPTREAIVDLDMYEKARQPRRNRKELKLSFEARRGILENERGFTVEEVKKAWSEALEIRKQRQETRLQAPHQRMMDEIYESACRKYNRLFEWNTRLCQ